MRPVNQVIFPWASLVRLHMCIVSVACALRFIFFVARVASDLLQIYLYNWHVIPNAFQVLYLKDILRFKKVLHFIFVLLMPFVCKPLITLRCQASFVILAFYYISPCADHRILEYTVKLAALTLKYRASNPYKGICIHMKYSKKIRCRMRMCALCVCLFVWAEQSTVDHKHFDWHRSSHDILYVCFMFVYVCACGATNCGLWNGGR